MSEPAAGALDPPGLTHGDSAFVMRGFRLVAEAPVGALAGRPDVALRHAAAIDAPAPPRPGHAFVTLASRWRRLEVETLAGPARTAGP